MIDDEFNTRWLRAYDFYTGQGFEGDEAEDMATGYAKGEEDFHARDEIEAVEQTLRELRAEHEAGQGR